MYTKINKKYVGIDKKKSVIQLRARFYTKNEKEKKKSIKDEPDTLMLT